MIDPKEAAKLIRQHFDELTTEQFVENLHRSCPEIFEDNQRLAKSEGQAIAIASIKVIKPYLG